MRFEAVIEREVFSEPSSQSNGEGVRDPSPGGVAAVSSIQGFRAPARRDGARPFARTAGRGGSEIRRPGTYKAAPRPNMLAWAAMAWLDQVAASAGPCLCAIQRPAIAVDTETWCLTAEALDASKSPKVEMGTRSRSLS